MIQKLHKILLLMLIFPFWISIFAIKSESLPVVECAFYRDINADGVIDLVTLKFREKISISGMEIILNWQENKTGILRLQKLYNIEPDSSTVLIDVVGAFSQNVKNKTNGLISAEISISGFVEPVHCEIADSAAPVLTSAILRKKSVVGVEDTLIVSFSEALIGIPENKELKHLYVFQSESIYNPTLQLISYSFDTANNIYTHWYRLLTIGTNLSLNKGSSIFINSNYPIICDLAGNHQYNPNNRRVIIETETTSIIQKHSNTNSVENYGLSIYDLIGRNVLRAENMVSLSKSLSAGKYLFKNNSRGVPIHKSLIIR